MYLKERVAYLKGLADGMKLEEGSKEGKLLKAIIDVLDDMALAVDDLEEAQEQLSEQVDSLDEDLTQVENMLFEEDADEDDDEESLGELECPHCNQTIELTEDMFKSNGDAIICPNCHKEIEVDWECDCEHCEETE